MEVRGKNTEKVRGAGRGSPERNDLEGIEWWKIDNIYTDK